ncbi:nascent polypeptide-associated complex subunit beta [Histoplasma capsulatum var. duboisii H88]|uniref:Nascent polypeptide-associated complex subunit beta n=1 Tax=Ajellomyces capsulatus (strain H88) TaxID=544711 RepID=A0A8A1LEM7_AJEC8|nr:nascent polypeptide-associated complex subunit beta [Histoplasma capsulatum var. duboisii H88]
MCSPFRPLRRSTCSRKTEMSSTLLPPKSTPPCPATPSPSTAMAKTKSSPSLYLESSTSWDLTLWLLSVNWQRAIRACRRGKVEKMPRRMMMTMMTRFQI